VIDSVIGSLMTDRAAPVFVPTVVDGMGIAAPSVAKSRYSNGSKPSGRRFTASAFTRNPRRFHLVARDPGRAVVYGPTPIVNGGGHLIEVAVPFSEAAVRLLPHLVYEIWDSAVLQFGSIVVTEEDEEL
jgi:hypothetical protein